MRNSSNNNNNKNSNYAATHLYIHSMRALQLKINCEFLKFTFKRPSCNNHLRKNNKTQSKPKLSGNKGDALTIGISGYPLASSSLQAALGLIEGFGEGRLRNGRSKIGKEALLNEKLNMHDTL